MAIDYGLLKPSNSNDEGATTTVSNNVVTSSSDPLDTSLIAPPPPTPTPVPVPATDIGNVRPDQEEDETADTRTELVPPTPPPPPRRRRRSTASCKKSLQTLATRELHAAQLLHAQTLAELFFLQNIANKINVTDLDVYVRKAHSALLSFLKSKTLDSEDADLLIRALYNGRVPQNSPLRKPPSAPSPAGTPEKTTKSFPTTSVPGTPTSAQSAGYSGLGFTTPGQSSLLAADLQKLHAGLGYAETTVAAVSSAPKVHTPYGSSGWSGAGGITPSGSQHGFGVPSTPLPSPAATPGTAGPKKLKETPKPETSVMQRISELQKEGMWYDKRLPKIQEPARIKAHWDYLLEEMTWLAADFATERKWKRAASKKCAKMIEKYWSDLEIEKVRQGREEEARVRRIAAFIAKEIKNFWSNAQQIVEYKEQSRIEEMKKKAMDQQLDYIVDQTEKFSSIIAVSFGDQTVPSTSQVEEEPVQRTEVLSDDEFEPQAESEEDDEETIAKEEEENEDQSSSINELDELEKTAQMPIDDLLDELPPGYLDEWNARIAKLETSENDVNAVEVKTEETVTNVNASKPENTNDSPVKPEETTADEEIAGDSAADASDASETEMDESDMEESGSASEDDHSTDDDESDLLSEEEPEPEDEEQTMGLASLLQTCAPERAGEDPDDAALNSVAAMAESFQPKGYTLSSTTVVTKIPSLLHHTLREYQHIGLDWLVTMCDKKLNGILADEMGLGKTIQTIALLAHLACEKGNWGPHLVVVPTSVMLNWEMEFKKWCPGFKILTYYGSIKERRLKRTGWTKPNAFHVCITSYKLVIQDHAVFRRKRWKYLILDEAQNIKNFKSQRWQLLLNFATQRRLLLTGTPLQNNLMELWSLMHFLMPNVFQSHREFREWFSNPVTGMVEGNSEYNDAIIARLHKVLRPFILRRLKSEVEKQLPQKYEHVVMCRLSKRQRFLYEDFMSRAKTKESLASGSLLSVINVLMQLRKVCNHPNLFEPRPVISPLRSEGLTYLVPSIAWKAVTFDEDGPLFTLTKADALFGKLQGSKIRSSVPLRIDFENLSEEMAQINETRSKRKMFCDDEISLEQLHEIDFDEDENALNSKRSKLNHWLLEMSQSAPKAKTPIPFILMNTDPSDYLEDELFVEAIGVGAPPPVGLRIRDSQDYIAGVNGVQEAFDANIDSSAGIIISQEEALVKVEPADEEVYAGMDSVVKAENVTEEEKIESDDENASDASESTDDDGPPKKKMRTEAHDISYGGDDGTKDAEDLDSSRDELTEATGEESPGSDDEESTSIEDTDDIRDENSFAFGSEWVEAMQLDPFEFQETDIHARSLRNRKSLIDRLQSINERRCEIFPLMGQDTIEQCCVVGHLPVMRYYGTRMRHLKLPFRPKTKNVVKDTFKLGYDELVSIALLKTTDNTRFRSHPLTIWRHTKALIDAVWTLPEVMKALNPILQRFIIYIPAVAATPLSWRIFRPSVSHYAQYQRLQDEICTSLKTPAEILHPIASLMSTQFPDPRLIQYDCGKLQVLETLLRRLKTDNHRVLVFTQMARMLDVLEAFLNYHGHIYLRLDGSTRIDQRQILMEKFNSDKRIFCFILSTRSGGIGVNLTGADTVIFYDSDWNPTMDAQAQDRCHRIGQTRDVHIYRLVSEKTIEENILKKSNQKRYLSELAIEGGNFTTAYFQKHSIYELFNVQTTENDPLKRLTDQPSLAQADSAEMESSSATSNPQEPDRNKIQLFESALASAEDETDVEATRNVQAEAAAELAEFDENIPLEELGDGQEVLELSAIDAEMASIEQELTKVEIYALRFMERTIDDWSRETVAQAQKQLEQQKREWELEQARQSELRSKRLGDLSDDEELITYSSQDAENQVWISQGGSEEFMPLWAPPTPPSDEMDVYVDDCHGFLYEFNIIPEASLPAIYEAPKKDKKSSPLASSTLLHKQASSGISQLMDEDGTSNSTMAVTTDKKSPKIARRDEPIFPPKSLFDRPSPAIAKIRRDHRLSRYNKLNQSSQPITSSKPALPGAVTFPITSPSGSKPPVSTSHGDSVEWMITEDNALLQTIQDMLEMPLSLLVVNLAQTPNWDLAAEMVHSTSRMYRTPKQCKIRYENTVRPREKGEVFYEQPLSAKSKKKTPKSFIKLGPPSPSRTGRIVKMSQLMNADNNSQLLNFYTKKFETLKGIASKRATGKPVPPVAPNLKTAKQAQVLLSEHNVNFDNPLSATAIAQARFERLQMERRKILAAQAQQASQSGGVSGVPYQGNHMATSPAYSGPPTPDSSRIATAGSMGQPMTTLVTSTSFPAATGPSLVQTPAVSLAPSGLIGSTASEAHKAKQVSIAQPGAVTTNEAPVIRLPSASSAVQEMLTRRVSASSVPPAGSLVNRRQLTATQQQSQLQQQLQLLQQHQLKHPKIALQVTQIKSGATGTLQSVSNQLSQLPCTTPQQIVISQPGKNQLPNISQAASVQLQNPKQVVMAYPQAVGQQQRQGQSIQIQLSGASAQSVSGMSTSTGQQMQLTSQSQPMIISQGQQQVSQSGIHLQTSTGKPGISSVMMQQTAQTGNTSTQLQPTTIQIQAPKPVVMAYPSTLPVSSQPQIIHTKPGQPGQPTQVHVHLQQATAGQLGQQSTVVLPASLAQALNSSVSTGTITTISSTGLMTMTTSDPTVTNVGISQGIGPGNNLVRGTHTVSQQLTGAQQSPQGQRTVTMQLIKQPTLGGKALARTTGLSDADLAAFLKQHGITTASGARVAIATHPVSGQMTQLPKGSTAQQVQVPTQIITSVGGLQKLGYQIATSTSGSHVQAVLKQAGGQQVVSSAQGTVQGTSVAFPLTFSTVKNVGQKSPLQKQATAAAVMQQQQVVATGQRRQVQSNQPTASKLAHITQVSQGQGNVPQLIVQGTQKQIQTALNAQSLQGILKAGHVPSQPAAGMLQTQLLTPNTKTTQITRPSTSVNSGQQLHSSVPASSNAGLTGSSMVTQSSVVGAHPPPVTVTGIVTPQTLQGTPTQGLFRFTQSSQSPRTIQMITGHPQTVLLNQQQVAGPEVTFPSAVSAPMTPIMSTPSAVTVRTQNSSIVTTSALVSEQNQLTTTSVSMPGQAASPDASTDTPVIVSVSSAPDLNSLQPVATTDEAVVPDIGAHGANQ